MKNIFKISLIVFSLSACVHGSDSFETFEYGESESASCAVNPEHTYHYFLPNNGNLDSLPLLIVLDPDGDGSGAVERFRSAVQYAPMVVISSNLIRNGYPDYLLSIKELIEEASTKFQIDNTDIYLAGFSGGARMAMDYARKNRVSGLLMAGAGPSGNVPDFRFYGICGIQDFNFMELYQRPVVNQLTIRDFQIDYFHGPHQWPGEEALEDAMLYLMLGTSEAFNKRAEERANELIAISDSLRGQVLLAWKAYEKAFQLTSSEENRKIIMDKAIELSQDQNFDIQNQNLENYLRLEANMRQQYVNNSLTEDAVYWNEQVKLMKEKVSFSSNSMVIDHNMRLKGFLGILFYTRLNVMLYRDDQLEQAKVLIDAFAQIEPENPDMFFFKTLYYTKLEQMDSASHYLALARKYGLKE